MGVASEQRNSLNVLFFHQPQDCTLSQLLEHQLGNAGPTSDLGGAELGGFTEQKYSRSNSNNNNNDDK